ncbi:hypothetical protein F4821DRAFT_64696 [Hypoxylon rubiginosum]|uniref:Uncharacterized protein n=1 Tax=Hypoxylon rubiginosum TaxID=110542 RepID=A0ACC0CIT8_9PEZI|nr:hypothetical protein F4821DRAFT_64696 [Hypoxylon rubiginosum]
MSNLFPNPAQLFRLNTAESLHPTKASDKGQVDDVKVINDTKSDTGMSDAILQRDRRQEKCFACGQWVGEHLQACAKCLSKLTVPYHALREAIEKLKNRSASEIPDQDPGAATQHLPTSTTRRKTVKEVTEEDREGGLRVQFPVAATSKDKLMKFLEFSYPDHYEIGLTQDQTEYNIFIRTPTQPTEQVSMISRFLKSLRSSRTLDREPDAPTHGSPTNAARPMTIQALTDKRRQRGLRVRYPTSRISKDELKEQLDLSYPYCGEMELTEDEEEYEVFIEGEEYYCKRVIMISQLLERLSRSRVPNQPSQGIIRGTLKMLIHTNLKRSYQVCQSLQDEYPGRARVEMRNDLYNITIKQVAFPLDPASALYFTFYRDRFEFVSFEESDE